MRFQEDRYYIDKTLQGDLKSYGLLIRKHENYALTLAIRILRDKQEAEEVVQDAFIKVHQSLSSFEGKSKFSTWLYKIVYNEALSKLRKTKAIHTSLDEIHESEDAEPDSSNGLHLLELDERKKIIKKALGMIKPTEAAALTLFYLEEQSIKEMEEIMELKTSHVKILLHRGRKSLMEALKKIAAQELTHLL
ncbi:RNA polymerase sigma factor [Algoriphagus halophytocola]|uniref:RNA polymerase sigma factor n=1 Tax=Algoriphagus halophytocola TaxID=2991499 RepID=A0ABY6MIF0_9BACT|nr:RNA polymerase sigma factor [Algoriphagus sp. TR-M5]UZD22441.1 RNA polymerase sigma factor [Algoriphagus sp. TR-M5]